MNMPFWKSEARKRDGPARKKTHNGNRMNANRPGALQIRMTITGWNRKYAIPFTLSKLFELWLCQRPPCMRCIHARDDMMLSSIILLDIHFHIAAVALFGGPLGNVAIKATAPAFIHSGFHSMFQFLYFSSSPILSTQVEHARRN